ncbi:succinate dehydrogenase assembly factor 2-B, mitochondrial-like [Atheta coriaria]|uniref:succinate dehydrogenase assembly factor 2-B, mitochondrial-like n=1 Tax=Dalotia coriaria TaxID=877792 RepID=UPI0031F3C526
MNFLTSLKLVRNFRAVSRHLTSIRMSSQVIEPPDDYIELPRRVHRGDEDLVTRKSRLLYQSRKRGMLENDLLLSTFADKYLQDMSYEEVEEYDKLINQPSNDWEIFYWATGVKPVPPEYDNYTFKLFKEHTMNLKKEVRLRQPDVKEMK